ncbi:hypothetical protein SKAU_G00425550 [Synaphobranchus kaupii]|uniref:Uncharacterized protein n=1 Tax=Synaphobranchus kaupii TaxID=118154 RepID=A0A9Q1E515_SYNKA|nr:hypothetical protein SKAU_G00425550 [Synaphobranchus kaupii]
MESLCAAQMQGKSGYWTWLGLSQLEGFRRHLLEVLQKSNKPKWRIIMGGTKCIPKSELPVDNPPQGPGDALPSARLWLHPSDLTMALSSSTPLYPPGKIIHVVHNHPAESCCGQEEPTYSALWADNKAFDEVIISPAMLNEHLPHMVMEGLNKVLKSWAANELDTEPEPGEMEAGGCLANTDILPSTKSLPSTPSHASTASSSPSESDTLPLAPALTSE